MIKMIATDLDGTLLNPGGLTIPRRNCDVLRRASESGIKVVICTGRIFAGGQKWATLFPGDIPVICVNGAIIRFSRSERYITRHGIKKEAGVKVMEMLRRTEVKPWFYLGDICYGEKMTEDLEALRVRTGAEIRIVPCLEELLDLEPEKILGIFSLKRAEEVHHRLEQTLGSEVYVTRSGFGQLEVLSPYSTKGRALETLAGKMGIAKEEIAVFGDNLNDLEMFRAAGIRVAMDNGEPELKEKADIIAPSCEDAGVAQVLEKLIPGL